jgi:integrase/recombinase XerD
MLEQLEKYKNYCINLKKSLVYYDILKPFLIYLNKKQLNFLLLSKDDIANYLQIKNYKTASINTLFNAIRSFCKYQDIDKHVIYQMKTLEPEKRQPHYITYDELLNAIKYYATYNNRGMSSMKCSALLKFLFFTGLRKSEILNLKREEIDLTNCAIKVYGIKDKEERLVYFPDTLIKELTDYFNSEPQESNAFNITKTELWWLTKKISKHLGKSISPHTLRHSFATYLMNKKNVSPAIVQRIMGHSSIETTMIYANPDDKMAQEEYKKRVG